MSHDDSDDDLDDEDWYDDDTSNEEDSVPCPECGEPVHELADRCPACGYWVTDADRAASAKPAWIRMTAIVVLAALVLGLLAMVVARM